KFVDAAVPQEQYLGLTIPDPGMKQNAAGNWEYSAIDWEEFNQVLAGNGPCNRERLAARRKAHDDGAWVREAAAAYAEKRKGRQLAQAAEERGRGWQRQTPRSGKFSSAAATGLRTSTAARCMPPTPPWRCRPRATSTPAAARGCRSGA